MRRTVAALLAPLLLLAACSSKQDTQVYKVPVGDAPVRGPQDAWVTIVEFADFQCPYCAKAEPTIDRVRQEYGDDVRIAYKHMPLSFHERARPAAIASECAREQGKFWEMHDLLYANQPKFSDEELRSYATQLGLDLQAYDACLTSQPPQDRIAADEALAQELGIGGTPAFFINGRLLAGAYPFDDFKKVIDDELQKAKSSGLAKGGYYDKAVLGR